MCVCVCVCKTPIVKVGIGKCNSSVAVSLVYARYTYCVVFPTRELGVQVALWIRFQVKGMLKQIVDFYMGISDCSRWNQSRLSRAWGSRLRKFGGPLKGFIFPFTLAKFLYSFINFFM